MRRIILYLTFILPFSSGTCAFAKNATIKGNVKSAELYVGAASVTLLSAKDSSWIKSVITEDDGTFMFKELVPGKYLINASSIGYKMGSQIVDVKENKEYALEIELQKESTSLNEVAVTARKPFIEMSMGKLVVNIEGTATTGASSVIDLLRRLPGVTVDQNSNISMNGKTGVLVLIDDRPTYLSGDDLANYLKTISADETAQIELITQPGAKYDAAGNTGIINIKLKKNKKQGWNGNLMLSYGEGVYFHRNESLMLNYKKNKLNISLSGNDMEAIGFADWKQNMYYLDDQTGSVTGNSYLHSTEKERFSNTALRLSADYDLTGKTTIGANIRGTYHPNSNHGYATDATFDQAANSTTYNNIATTDGFIRKDVMTNVYLSHKFSKESSLDINTDYLSFSRNEQQDINNTTYNGQMQPFPDPLILNSVQPSSIKVYSVKADYNYAFKNEVKLEAGLKSSWVTTDNNAMFSLYENNAWVHDTTRSNHFLYKENINAIYLTLTKSLGKKWEARAGIRVEETSASGLQYVGNNQFARNYISPFPTAYITYKMDTDNKFELNFGRRIDRSDYKSLNPFIKYSFMNTYEVGNPYLQPQYTNSVELKHSYKNMIISTLTVSGTTDVMSSYLKVDDSTKDVYSLQGNFASNNYISYDLIFNKELFKWWTLNVSGSIYYASYTGLINNITRTITWDGGSLNLSSQFDFGNGWKAEVYGNYVGKGRWSLTSSFSPNVYMSFGLSKKVSERILLKFNAEDPFNIYNNKIHDASYNYSSDSKFRFASQMFALSVSYNFGSTQQGSKRDNSLDEAKRIR